MMTKLRKQVFVALTLTFSVQIKSQAVPEITLARAEQIAKQVVDNERIRITQHGYKNLGFDATGARKKCFHFSDESESISIDINCATGDVYRYQSLDAQMSSKIKKISPVDAERRGTRFFKKFTMSPLKNEFQIKTTSYYDRGAAGLIYEVVWEKTVNGITLPSALTISISAESGQVVRYLLIDNDVSLTELSPKVTRDEVIHIVSERAGTSFSKERAKAELNVMGVGRNQALVWRVVGLLPGAAGDEARAKTLNQSGVFYINAITGQDYDVYGPPSAASAVQLPEKIAPQINQNFGPHPSALRQVDMWPTFGATGDDPILFYKWTELELDAAKKSAESSSPIRAQLATTTDKGQRSLLDTPFILHSPSWTADGKRVVFEEWPGDVVFLLDIETGLIGRFNDGQRAFFRMPDISRDGSLVTVSGYAPGVKGDHNDIYVGNVSRNLSNNSLRKLRCVVQMKGRETLPCFNFDGSAIMFAHKDEDASKGSNWSICKVNTDKSYDDVKYIEPETLTDGIHEPERLSWFLNDSKVLISYANEEGAANFIAPEILDVVTRKRTVLDLPVLHDPDFPKSQPLLPNQISVNKSGSRIMFSARCWSGNSSDVASISIYTCALNGSDIKCLTRSSTKDLEAYQYTLSKTSSSTAWRTLEPKPNLGHHWTPGLQKKEHESDLEKLKNQALQPN